MKAEQKKMDCVMRKTTDSTFATVTIKNKVTRLKCQLRTARSQLSTKKAEKDAGYW